jgi:hypothetical protein
MAQSPIALLAAAFVVMMSGSPAAAPASPVPRVTVRVVDLTGEPASHVTAALDEAGRVISGAAVHIDWTICQLDDPSGPCSLAMAPGERVVRIVSASTTIRAGRVRLGYAALDPAARTGVLATVYLDPIVKLTSDGPIDEATLLGRAIAHELGHLLLGANAHSRHGLMRAAWTKDEVRRNRESDWTFSESEGATMRRHVSTPVNSAVSQRR